jgi:hypothetical protein
MRIKPTEIRLVAEVIGREYDSAEEAAEAAIRAIDEKRARDNEIWCFLYYDPNNKVFITYGPYPTKSSAERARKNLVSPGPLPARGMPLKLREEPE